MAKSRSGFPRLHVKTAIAAALILFLPLVVLVASSPKLNETRSSAYHDSGNIGGGKLGNFGKFGFSSFCVTNTSNLGLKSKTTHFNVAWSPVINATDYIVIWRTSGSNNPDSGSLSVSASSPLLATGANLDDVFRGPTNMQIELSAYNSKTRELKSKNYTGQTVDCSY